MWAERVRLQRRLSRGGEAVVDQSNVAGDDGARGGGPADVIALAAVDDDEVITQGGNVWESSTGSVVTSSIRAAELRKVGRNGACLPAGPAEDIGETAATEVNGNFRDVDRAADGSETDERLDSLFEMD